MSEYTHPDVLVSADWLQEHIDDPNIRIVESNEDILLYNTGHIRNAVKIDWQNDLQDELIRDYISKEKFEELMSKKGISNDTTVVFYGDKSNWWACYAFWTFTMYGHTKCKLLNGGRQKWVNDNREMTKDTPDFPATEYKVSQINEDEIRAFREHVLKHIDGKKPLIDVRSPGEYTGELLHMPDYPQEGSLRGGHIPGAKSVPWSQAANDDGTFKDRKALEELYAQGAGIAEEDDVIVYCRIGERSSHTWFVLRYLLGYKNVRNYDGSWTEWGNLVRVPIEKP
ncbi:sulfurtransferase [Candidatus Uabimicrobium amorphum]|uniref:Sulfurtransferase n=1 Tax=Uabimicrobium amorphum TaxID=2596890 RepID=A0A5S9F4P9_UABAM|nr:sulfurtransferase [Candidatus Uabimicrobium amorphum]BBM86016.1 sulfurtransferase [Candidatus Uabimicrobium amorphum]